jgi:hypothetical protein
VHEEVSCSFHFNVSNVRGPREWWTRRN